LISHNADVTTDNLHVNWS